MGEEALPAGAEALAAAGTVPVAEVDEGHILQLSGISSVFACAGRVRDSNGGVVVVE